MSNLKQAIANLLKQIPVDFGGGCSEHKAWVMATLIKEYQLTTSVDIGVYRGRSFLPQALAQKAINGKVFGVDPYSNQEAMQNDRPDLKEQLDAFVQQTDFQALYEKVVHQVNEHQLNAHAEIIRTTSALAAPYFTANNIQFGLIHIDGNHDTAAVMQDYALYKPLLKPGGFLVLDDISWPSVKPVLMLAKRELKMVYQKKDTENDFAVFTTRQSFVHDFRLKRQLDRLLK
ncbi:MAG TPA: class I SAM-dependent methyltransferase [Phnomibacter sp.]|nr:class I SAM-dependent methyltransferase [Phnomibacter sp.]